VFLGHVTFVVAPDGSTNPRI